MKITASTSGSLTSSNNWICLSENNLSNSSSSSIEQGNVPDIPVESAYSETSADDLNILGEIASWATKGNVSHSNVNGILSILRKHPCFSHFPKDSRTLLHTPRSYSVQSVPPGSYHHFGIESGVLETLKYIKSNQIPKCLLKIHTNVDGLPLAKSSGSQFWPILGALPQFSKSPPFIIAVYHGLSKPECCNVFLDDFVLEANNLKINGFVYKGQHLFVEFSAFTCDAPARAFVKKI